MPKVDPLEQTAPVADHTMTATGAAVSSDGSLTGKQLGHFRIERKLGAGGMGEVYLATDLALDRPVAVKVLPEAVAREPKRRDRLIREARAQAKVVHPHVGHMYFVGEEEHRLYFAMEYVAGETLADRIAKGPMPVEDALDVIRSVALGLREAHKAGITHRDIKPSNLMLDAHGLVKVLDFGLAAGDLEAGRGTGPVAQTSLAGTPLYMAPEQARGDAVDFRTDIYALGATLYHLVSGKPPFEADSIEDLVSLHATATRPALPRRGQRRVQIGAIEALCRRMMHASPEHRFESYDELVRAIELASDVHTKPAGFLARCVAMLVDVMIVRIVVAVAQAVVDLTTDYELEPNLMFFPVLAVMLALTTTRWGRTPGKSVMELEVVDIATLDRPRLAGVVRRMLMMLGPPTAAVWAEAMLTKVPLYGVEDNSGPGLTIQVSSIAGIVITGWIILGISSLGYSSLRSPGKRTLWDRAGRTMVRYRTTRRSVAGS